MVCKYCGSKRVKLTRLEKKRGRPYILVCLDCWRESRRAEPRAVGFTLIELLVVCVIMCILLGLFGSGAGGARRVAVSKLGEVVNGALVAVDVE